MAMQYIMTANPFPVGNDPRNYFKVCSFAAAANKFNLHSIADLVLQKFRINRPGGQYGNIIAFFGSFIGKLHHNTFATALC